LVRFFNANGMAVVKSITNIEIENKSKLIDLPINKIPKQRISRLEYWIMKLEI
jgi:hypothetical protein